MDRWEMSLGGKKNERKEKEKMKKEQRFGVKKGRMCRRTGKRRVEIETSV